MLLKKEREVLTHNLSFNRYSRALKRLPENSVYREIYSE